VRGGGVLGLIKLTAIGILSFLLAGCSDEGAITSALANQLQLSDSQLRTQNLRFTERLSAGRRWACVEYSVPDTNDYAIAMAYRTSSKASWTVLDLNSTSTACEAVQSAVTMMGVQGLPAEIVDSLESVLAEFSDAERVNGVRLELAKAGDLSE